jgi:hypothetical protein
MGHTHIVLGGLILKVQLQHGKICVINIGLWVVYTLRKTNKIITWFVRTVVDGDPVGSDTFWPNFGCRF